MSKLPRTKPWVCISLCIQDQICTIHRLVTFEPKSLGGEWINPNQTKQSHDNTIENKIVTKDFYQIPTRNKYGEIEVLTVLKDNISTVNKITDTALDEFVSHKKPELQDAPIY